MFVHSNYVQNCRSEHSGVFLVLVTLSNFILVFSLRTGNIYLFWSWSCPLSIQNECNGLIRRLQNHYNINKSCISNVFFLSETCQIYQNNKGLFSTLNFVSIFHFILSFLCHIITVFYRPFTFICTMSHLFKRFDKIKHTVHTFSK